METCKRGRSIFSGLSPNASKKGQTRKKEPSPNAGYHSWKRSKNYENLSSNNIRNSPRTNRAFTYIKLSTLKINTMGI